MLTFIKKNPEFKVNKIKKLQNLNTFLFVFFKGLKTHFRTEKLGSRGTDEG